MPPGYRSFDCSVCLNRHANGKCKSLLQPPAGSTCGWYCPPPELDEGAERIRTLTAHVAASLQREFVDVFPDLTAGDWTRVVQQLPSIVNATRKGASIRRRILGISTEEVMVECGDCGWEIDIEEMAASVRAGQATVCRRCGGSGMSPAGL